MNPFPSRLLPLGVMLVKVSRDFHPNGEDARSTHYESRPPHTLKGLREPANGLARECLYKHLNYRLY
jgi:hypothetical protein